MNNFVDYIKKYPCWLIDEFRLADLNEIDYTTLDGEVILECLNSEIRADILILTLELNWFKQLYDIWKDDK